MRDDDRRRPPRGRAAIDGGSASVSGRRSAVYLRRRENTYEVDRALALELREVIGEHLPLFRYVPEHVDSYITTVYFDTCNRDLYHRASRSFDNNFKIRIKEYYYADSDADVPEPANGPYRCSRYCFVELKQRRDGIVFKRRFRLPKGQVAALFAGEDVSSLVFEGLSGKTRLSVEKTYGALRRYLDRVTVEVSSIVCYHRLVYQHSERELRVTFDGDVTVFAPPPGLYQEFEALTPDVLGSPIRRLDRVIMEIKCAGDYPPWLSEALTPVPSKRLSKFTSSVRFLMESDSARRAAAEGVDPV